VGEDFQSGRCREKCGDLPSPHPPRDFYSPSKSQRSRHRSQFRGGCATFPDLRRSLRVPNFRPLLREVRRRSIPGYSRKLFARPTLSIGIRYHASTGCTCAAITNIFLRIPFLPAAPRRMHRLDFVSPPMQPSGALHWYALRVHSRATPRSRTSDCRPTATPHRTPSFQLSAKMPPAKPPPTSSDSPATATTTSRKDPRKQKSHSPPSSSRANDSAQSRDLALLCVPLAPITTHSTPLPNCFSTSSTDSSPAAPRRAQHLSKTQFLRRYLRIGIPEDRNQ